MSMAAAPASRQQAPPRRAWLMLAMATLGFALNFWAWALLSPLGPYFKITLHLSSFTQALLVAIPVLVGAIGRIPVGALTDRLGGRIMFPAVTFATIVPVLLIGYAGYNSLAMLLVGGFFLGIAGTSFAVGVPFVNAWFPPHRRGLAIGLFGMGMGGTAISALTTVRLMEASSIHTPFLLVAAVLAAFGVAAAMVLREAPGRVVPQEPLGKRLGRVLRLPVTWQASAFYAIAFGGYVAFSVYLPTYLKNAYLLTQSDAATKMGGFVLIAVLMRPVGGYLADRIRPAWVLAAVFAVVAATALAQAPAPGLAPGGTITFLTMAGALGAGAGAVFALVAQRAPRNEVGAVTGVVGAAGGLGGFIPPLVMGTIYGSLQSYALGLIALAVVAVGAIVFAAAALQARPHGKGRAGAPVTHG
jgi:NNP family nitrate/nitrite transporter-like MFS transporter